jgi:Ca2+-binding RTX toxin-like protein
MTGDALANMLRGGAGGDNLDGRGGIDWVSYSGSPGAIMIDLSAAGGAASGGDAEGDTVNNFENVIGSDHDDVITGSNIANVLRGGGGADTLTGGADADTFEYTLPDDGTAVAGNTTHAGVTADNLTDFGTGTDQIVLDSAGFGLASGTLVDGNNFEVIGAEYDGTNATNTAYAAGDASVIRDSTGALIYDSDGAGPGYTILASSGAGSVVATDVVSQATVKESLG